MRSSILRIGFALIVLAFTLAPTAFVYAADVYPPPFVPCGWHGARCAWNASTGNPVDNAGKPINMSLPVETYEMCRFDDFVGVATGVVNGTIIMISVYAAISFMYAGYAYLTSGGSQEKVKYAKQIFYKVLVGYIVILTAWLIVYMIESTFFSTEMQQKSFLGAGTPTARTYPECLPDGATRPIAPMTVRPGFYTDPNCNGKCNSPALCVSAGFREQEDEGDDSGPQLMRGNSGELAAAILAAQQQLYTCAIPPSDFVYDCADCAAPKRCAATPSITDNWGNALYRCIQTQSAPDTPGETLCPCSIPTPPPVTTPTDTSVFYPEAFNVATCTGDKSSSLYSNNSTAAVRVDANVSSVKSIKFPIYKALGGLPFDFSNTLVIAGSNGGANMTALATSNSVTFNSTEIPDIGSGSAPFWATYRFDDSVALTGFSEYYFVWSPPSSGYQMRKTEYPQVCGSNQQGNIYFTIPGNILRMESSNPGNFLPYYGLLGINEPIDSGPPMPPAPTESTGLCPCGSGGTPGNPPPTITPVTGMFPQPFSLSDCVVAKGSNMYGYNNNVGYRIDPSIPVVSSLTLPVFKNAGAASFDFTNRLIIAGSNDTSAPIRLTSLGQSSNSVHFVNSLLPTMTNTPPTQEPYWAQYGFASPVNLTGYSRYYFYFGPPSPGYIVSGTDHLSLCGSPQSGPVYYTAPANPNVFESATPGNYPTYYNVFGGNGTPPPVATPRNLNVTIAGSGSGSVASNAGLSCTSGSCTEVYISGTEATLTASPASGSTFSGWSGGCTGTGSCQFTLNSDVEVTANFSKVIGSASDVTLRIVGMGNVTGTYDGEPLACSDNEITCVDVFDNGAVFNMTAAPKTGYIFAGWSGACSGTGACNFTLGADTAVTATFTAASLRKFSLSVTKLGTGSGSVSTSNIVAIDCGGVCSAQITEGTVVTLSATPSSGSVFGGWGGNCSGTSSTCTVTVDAATSVTAGFNTSSSSGGPKYYVTASGSGVKNGSDWSNAYAGIPASSLVRGATYYLASGTYGAYVFQSLPGTEYIYIRKATVADHGTATGWNDSFGSGQAVFQSNGASVIDLRTSYIDFEGMTGSGTSGYGIKIFATMYGANTELYSAAGIKIYNGYVASNIRFKHVEVAGIAGDQNRTYLMRSISNGGTDWLIQNSYFHDGGIWLGLYKLSNMVVENTYFQNAGGNAGFCSNGPCHYAGITLEGQNVTVRNNVFENMLGFNNTTYIEPQTRYSKNLYFYGNVFKATSPNEGTSQHTISLTSSDVIDGLYVYNNTFYGLKKCGIKGTGTIGGSSNVYVWNNIFQNCTDMLGFDGANSAKTNILNTGEARFISPGTGNFRLSQPTVTGTALPSPFNIDPEGKTRGSDGTWDIGAYEYNGTATN